MIWRSMVWSVYCTVYILWPSEWFTYYKFSLRNINYKLTSYEASQPFAHYDYPARWNQERYPVFFTNAASRLRTHALSPSWENCSKINSRVLALTINIMHIFLCKQLNLTFRLGSVCHRITCWFAEYRQRNVGSTWTLMTVAVIIA